MGAVNAMEAERWRDGEQVAQAHAEPDGPQATEQDGVARRRPATYIAMSLALPRHTAAGPS